MLRTLRSADRACRAFSGKSVGARLFGAQTEVGPTHYEVPEGHKNSDLSSSVCNIGLGRRRDLTLRADCKLYKGDQAHALADVLKGKLLVVFGVPDMGKICTEKHVPNYLSQMDKLSKAGVQSVVCIAITDPSTLASWADKAGCGDKVTAYADKNGGVSRLLGVDLPAAPADGPKTQRYAALVEDGILLKMNVEDSPGKLEKSTAEAMLHIIKDLKG